MYVMHHIDLNFTNNQYKTESIIRSLNSSSFKSDRVKKSKKKDDPSRHLPKKDFSAQVSPLDLVSKKDSKRINSQILNDSLRSTSPIIKTIRYKPQKKSIILSGSPDKLNLIKKGSTDLLKASNTQSQASLSQPIVKKLHFKITNSEPPKPKLRIQLNQDEEIIRKQDGTPIKPILKKSLLVNVSSRETINSNRNKSSESLMQAISIPRTMSVKSQNTSIRPFLKSTASKDSKRRSNGIYTSMKFIQSIKLQTPETTDDL